MDVKSGNGLWQRYKGKPAVDMLREEHQWYASDNPRLAQVYFYLIDYAESDLDEVAFANMDAFFEVLKELNVKALLRFTYRTDDAESDTGATAGKRYAQARPAQIVKHLEQLKPWLVKWQPQIHVLQAGLVGAWGEWDSGRITDLNNDKLTVRGVDNVIGTAAVLFGLLDNMPAGMYLQVRYAYNKTRSLTAIPAALVTQADRDRIGYHDDALVNVYASNNVGGNPDTANNTSFPTVINESKNLLIDGEMYWGGTYNSDNRAIPNGLTLAKRLQDMHFTSLSVTHNYKEIIKVLGASPSPPLWNMHNWQTNVENKITMNDLDNAASHPSMGTGLKYDPAWFTGGNGSPIERNSFEYIRDYLGYYLQVTGISGEVTENNQVKVSLKLKNYGFAAPIGLKSIDLVLLNADGTVAAKAKAFDLGDLQQGKEVTSSEVTLTMPNSQTAYKLALDIRSSNDRPARLANDIGFENGYNILGEYRKVTGN
jgi:hypothetical protein